MPKFHFRGTAHRPPTSDTDFYYFWHKWLLLKLELIGTMQNPLPHRGLLSPNPQNLFVYDLLYGIKEHQISHIEKPCGLENARPFLRINWKRRDQKKYLPSRMNHGNKLSKHKKRSNCTVGWPMVGLMSYG